MTATNKPKVEKTEKTQTLTASAVDVPAQESKASLKQAEREEKYGEVLDDGTIIESIYDKTKRPACSFVIAMPDGSISVEPSYTSNGVTTFPPLRQIKRFERRSVILPSGIEDYGSSEELLHLIKLHLAKFIDHEPYVISLMAHYAMMTHVWDAFSAVPYLRLKGQPGTGKSRCLKVMKDLCYRTVDLGAGMSKAALYRSIDNVGGTAIIDEAEFGGADLQAAVFQVLNKGYEKDGIVPLCVSNKNEDWDTRDFRVGGPKILANRHDFGDSALETRCLTIDTVFKKLSEHIQAEFPRNFEEEGNRIRGQLLEWRFDTLRSLDKSETALRHLDGRARQLALPIYAVSPDPEFRREFIERMEARSESLREDDPARIVLKAVSSIATQTNRSSIPMSVIRERALASGRLRDISDYIFDHKKVADLVRGLGFKTVKRSEGVVVLIDPKHLALQCEQFHLKDDASDDSDPLRKRG